MQESEQFNVYSIPANYTDSGKLLGGMLETRNTVEAGILVVLLGYPELMWLPDGMVKVVVMTLTLLPIGVFALMGVGGDSLMQYLGHVARFLIKRRKLQLKRIGYKYANTKKRKTPVKKR